MPAERDVENCLKDANQSSKNVRRSCARGKAAEIIDPRKGEYHKQEEKEKTNKKLVKA